MKNVFSKITLCSVAWGLAFSFSACGDGSTSSGGDTSSTDFVVETYDDLPVCSDKRQGIVAYVKDEKKAYVCRDGKWFVDETIKPSKDDSKGKSSDSKGSSTKDGSKTVTSEFDVGSGTLKDLRDNRSYKTVVIGDQVWMAENLNFEYNVKGSKYGTICYEKDSENCKIYGALYSWGAAMDSAGVFSDDSKGCGNRDECSPKGVIRGICPEGWHLPDTTEWMKLINYAGGIENKNAAKKLKSTEHWITNKDFTDNANGTDDYGFAILPAASASGVGSNGYEGFMYLGYAAYFWTSNEDDDMMAFSYSFDDTEHMDKLNSSKSIGSSIRCVWNEKASAINTSSKTSTDNDEKSSSSVSSSSSEKGDMKTGTGTVTDERDGKTYKTVTIGNQTWMAENLNFAYDGGETYCYNDKPDNCEKYGRLYSWLSAIDAAGMFSSTGEGCSMDEKCRTNGGRARGVCPKGWHLPDSTECMELYKAVGGADVASAKLKSTEGWVKTGYNDGNGSDAYGFNLLPAGLYINGVGYDLKDEQGSFWTSSEYAATRAYVTSMHRPSDKAIIEYQFKNNGYPVRCVED